MCRTLTISHHLPLLLLFLLSGSFPVTGLVPIANSNSTSRGVFLPASSLEYRAMDATGVAFQLCLDCRCCLAADPTDCSRMSCCFGIDCDLPGKPYGICAFVPQTCNCTSCS